MDGRLIIQLFLKPNCQLVAIDNSEYASWGTDISDHVMLEFLVYNTDSTPLASTIRLNKIRHRRDYYLNRFSANFILEKDGTYAYYKLVIPKLEHYISKTIDGINYYTIDNEDFFYEGHFYQGPRNTTGEVVERTLEECLGVAKQVDNYLDLYNNKGSQTFFYKQMVFSVCKLQKCLVSLQRKMLSDNIPACNFESCNNDQVLKNKCDFLLSALYVFDYLKDIRNFTEAQRLLENLSTCTSICEEELWDSNYNNCGCGNSI